jgi:hypothetical protein
MTLPAKLRPFLLRRTKKRVAADLPANKILSALNKLRQAATTPSLVGGSDQSSKFDAVIEKLDESVADGH